MKNSKNISIEQLATLLKGKFWEKGELKRIYLYRGYNTKKMKTTTYVFIDENNEIKVSCFVDCPSQPYAWCNSQKESVVEGVYNELEEILNNFVSEENSQEIAEIEVVEIPEQLKKMLSFEPLEIVKNPHYNPKLTNVKRVVNLSDTPFIDFYHGCERGYAYIIDEKLVAFAYMEDYNSKVKIDNAKKVRVDFSCTKICFTS